LDPPHAPHGVRRHRHAKNRDHSDAESANRHQARENHQARAGVGTSLAFEREARASARCRRHRGRMDHAGLRARRMTRMRQSFRSGLAVVAIVAGAGCVVRPANPRPAAPSIAIPRAIPNEIRWFRTSAEYRALTRQTYQLAADRLLELTRGAAAQSWAVILDADETVLDNSEYQRRRALDDSAYTEASWSAWVNERTATAIPGAP